MGKPTTDKTTTFFDELAAQSEKIQGRLVSGHRFTCKILTVGLDYCYVGELELEDGIDSGSMRSEDGDIIKLRHDAIMSFCELK